jgi:hypothetical protein
LVGDTPYACKEYAKAVLKIYPNARAVMWMNRRTKKSTGRKKVSRKALLTFADDGHILPGYFPGDIDSFALPNCRLRVMGRYVHDPASIGSAA